MLRVLLILLGIGPLASASPKPTYIETEQAKIPVFEYGHGKQTLILIHGGPGMPGYMNTLGKLIEDRFKVVEYYQRDSLLANSHGPFTLPAYVRDLEAVVERYSNGSLPILIAHSAGNIIALEHAKLHSDKITRLVLLSPAPLEEGSENRFNATVDKRLNSIPGFKQREKDAQAKLNNAKTADEKFAGYVALLDLYWPAYFPSGKKPDSLVIEKVNVDASDKISNDFSAREKAGEFTNALDKIKVPVCHFHGTYDPIPSDLTSEILKKNVSDYQLKLIEGAGHFPWLDPKFRTKYVSDLEDCLSGKKIARN